VRSDSSGQQIIALQSYWLAKLEEEFCNKSIRNYSILFVRIAAKVNGKI